MVFRRVLQKLFWFQSPEADFASDQFFKVLQLLVVGFKTTDGDLMPRPKMILEEEY